MKIELEKVAGYVRHSLASKYTMVLHRNLEILVLEKIGNVFDEQEELQMCIVLNGLC